MANLERTTWTSIEGGGFNMTEEALQIIEDYLSLVKAHLPSDIAEEVIEELRSYIREAASDNEEGMITSISAKRTVARFGAPSEVAEEYRFSMDAERIAEESAQTEIAPESELAQEEILIMEDTRESIPEITGSDSENPSRKAHYFETLIQTLFLIVCWSLITGVSGLPYTGFIAGGYILAACLILPLYFLYRKVTGVVLRDRTFEEWPWYMKLTTLPAGTFEPARQPFISMDMFVLIIGILGFGITSIAFPYALIAIPFILLRISIVRKYDTESFAPDDVKGEYVLNVFMAIILNFILGVALWNFEVTAIVFVMPFCILYGFYLVVILATTMAELWTETISISEPIEESVQQAPASIDEIRQYESSDEYIQAQDTSIVSSPKKEIEADRFKGLPLSYATVYLKIVTLSIFWIIVTGLISSILFPDLLYYPGSSILILGVFQLPIVIVVSIFKLLKMKRDKKLPWPTEDSTWSYLRKILSFPDHVFNHQKDSFLRLDILLTFWAVFLVLMYNLVHSFPGAITVFSTLFVGLGIFRLAILNHRWNNPESEKYNKREFLITFLLLIIGNVLFLNSMTLNWWNNQYDIFYTYSAIMYPLFLAIGWNLLYNLVARGSTLWREDSVSEGVTTGSEKKISILSDRSELLHNLGTRFKQTVSRILGWYVLMVAISAVIILFTTGVYSIIPITGMAGYLMNFWMSLLGFSFLASITIVTLQFTYRRYMLKSGRSEHIIGKRGRIQAFLDLVVTGVLLGTLLVYWSTGMYSFIYSIRNTLPLNFSFTFILLQISILVAVVLLWGALMGRLFSDLSDFVRPGSATGTKLLIISGIMLALSTAIFVAYSIILSNGSRRIIFGFEMLAQVSLLVIAITQVVTSQMKQSQKEVKKEIEVEIEQALEDGPESTGPPIIESS